MTGVAAPKRQDGMRFRQGARALLIGLAFTVSLASSSAAAVSPRQLVEVADLGDPVMSPDGRQVAFRLVQASVDRNAYDSAWYVQAVDGGTPPVRIADGGVPLRNSAGWLLPAPAVWAPDGRSVYFRAFADDKLDVWRAASDGSRAEAVTGDAADVRDFVLAHDGKSLTYSVGVTRDVVREAEEAEYADGIRVDATTPLGQPLFRSGLVDGRRATQRLGFWADRVSLMSDVPDRWKVLAFATRESRDTVPPPDVADAIAQDVPRGASVVAREPGGVRVAMLTPAGGDATLRRKPHATLSARLGGRSNPEVTCTDALCRDRPITSVQWRPGSDEVVATVTDLERGVGQSILRWNVRTGAVHSVVVAEGLLNGGRIESSRCGVSTQALVCVAAEAGAPPRLERVDLASGERRVLFAPNAALGATIAARVPPFSLQWTNEEGHAFNGQFFPARSTGGKPPPLFVSYYRCAGFVRGGYGEEWPMAALAERGISALCINAAPLLVDSVGRYELGTSAVRSVVDLLAADGRIDRSRVGMGGLSFGTEVTMWTAMHSDLLSAASITSPLLSPTYYLMGTLKGDAFLSGLQDAWQVGSPKDSPQRWKRISPAYNVDAITAPLLMQMPEQEYIFALDYAIPLLRAKKAELHVFPDEPHVKFQPRHLLATQTRNVDWFAFWLLGEEDPDPAKAAQYRQWRELKGAAPARAASP